MLSAEKIASIISIFHKLIYEYTLGEDSPEFRLYKASMDRIKSKTHVNDLAKYVQNTLIPLDQLIETDRDLIAQYTFNTSNTTKFFDTFGEMKDVTTVHISVIDVPQLSRGKDNYYCCSKDNRNIFILIPLRMLDLSDGASGESINYFVNLICRICDDYYVPELAAYIFAKKIYKIDNLVNELYSKLHIINQLESYIDNEIPNLLVDSYEKIITDELSKLQSGDATLWSYLEESRIIISEGLNEPIHISHYKHDEENDTWILV